MTSKVSRARLVDEDGRPTPSVAYLLAHAPTVEDLMSALVYARATYTGASAATKRKWQRVYDRRMNELLGSELVGLP